MGITSDNKAVPWAMHVLDTRELSCVPCNTRKLLFYFISFKTSMILLHCGNYLVRKYDLKHKWKCIIVKDVGNFFETKLFYTCMCIFIYKHFNVFYQINVFQCTYCGFLMSSFRMKSLASGDTSENASSAKSQSQRPTFCRVSRSSSPAKGDNPLNLWNVTHNSQIIMCHKYSNKLLFCYILYTKNN